MIKVLVFGVFDGLHEGHKFFLREAKGLGNYLIVVVAPNPNVVEIKRKVPKQNLEERMGQLKNEDCVDEVVVGDAKLRSWEVLEKHRPDIIALGYDQLELKKSLVEYFGHQTWRPELKTLPPFEERKLKSSLLNNLN